jgi:hypothetical protein
MVPPSQASAIIWRREPWPLSAVVVTTPLVKQVTTVVKASELLFSLFGSAVSEVIVTVLEKVAPGEAVLGMWATKVKLLVLPTGRLAFVHDTPPPEPPEGPIGAQFQLGPASWVIDTNVMLAGSVSVKVALVALLGPPLVTWML